MNNVRKKFTLQVFDTDFNRHGAIRVTKSTVWKESYRDRGSFMLVASDTPDNVRLLQIGWYYYRPEKQTAMMIVSLERDSVKGEITARGFSTTWLLDQRVIYPTVFINGNVEAGMYNLINSNRRLPRLVTAPVKGLQGTIDTQFTGKEMLKTLNELAALNDWGFKTIFDWENKQHVFTIYQGTDRTQYNGVVPPIIASDRTGGLGDIKITEDNSAFKNVAIVAGEDTGSNRVVVEVGNAQGLDRFETFVDARDLRRDELTLQQYQNLLTSRGKEKLSEMIKSFNFVALPKTGPQVSNIFDTNYFNGDKITSISKRYLVELDNRIMASEEVLEGNFNNVYLTIGEPMIRRWGTS